MAPPIRLTGIRAATAKKMQESLASTAQLTFHTDCRATLLADARARWKSAGHEIGYDDLLLHALAPVLREFPHFNGIETEEGLELDPRVNVNYAVAVGGRLVAPVIRGLEDKSVPDIAAARREIVEAARRGQLKVTDMTGGSFTVSSLGQTAVRYFTPILNHPQKAILGVGRIEKRPWVDRKSDQVVAADCLGLSLTVDHRWIDGEPAGEFLNRFCHRVENEVSGPPSAA